MLAAEARAQRSAYKSVVEKPSWRVEWVVSRLLVKETVDLVAGCRSPSRFQLDLVPQMNIVRRSGRAMRARMAVLHAFRS